VLLQLSLRLQGRTFGAPRPRPEPAARAGASNRGEQSGRETGDKRQGSPGLRRCGAAAFSSHPSGGSPTARRAAAHGFPGTGRSRSPRRNAPMPRPTSRTRPSRSRQVTRSPYEDHSHRAGTPRIVQVGPSCVKGTPRSFLTASQKGSSGPTLECRSLCRPSGPDGEGQARGQARSARGEPPNMAPIGETGQSRRSARAVMSAALIRGSLAVLR
jgi:hypothetical protein